jgi:prepilin-type N-terminal cleavage/methylation domain-containing protein
MNTRHAAGFTLTELLVTLAIVSIVMTGVTGFFVSLGHSVLREQESSALTAGLRLGLDRIAADLRQAGHGVPQDRLALWIPWVSGFTENPQIAHDHGSDTLTVARCTSQPVAVLASAAAIGATQLTLTSTSGAPLRHLLNAERKRLIRIAESEFAHVTGTPSGTATASIGIDTQPDPTVSHPPAAANPGLSRPYPAGTPVCRVDVHTWWVDRAGSVLRLNTHHGAGNQPVVDGITALKLTGRYRITLEARSARRDPATREYLQRRMSTQVVPRNR